MKIQISKSQWEEVGRTAGWLKEAALSETIVPIDQIIGTRPTGKTETEIDEEMHSKGYFLFREHYRWGRTPSYRNKNNEQVYLDRDETGKLIWMSLEQLKAQIRNDWVPVSMEDQNWFTANLGPIPPESRQPIPTKGLWDNGPQYLK